MSYANFQAPCPVRARSSSEACFSGRNATCKIFVSFSSASVPSRPSWSSHSPAGHHAVSTAHSRKRHGVLSYDRNRNSWGDWSSSVERERMRREAELQRQRLQELLQQQMQQRPAWQTFLLPAVGAGFFALVLGPLFAVLLGAAALGASLVFSTAAFFILVPLTVATLAVTFGLSAGAFVIKGIVFSVFNLLLVGGALAAGFRLTNKLLGSTTPKESVDRQARAARAKAGPTSASGVIDIEAKIIEEETREVASMNAEELRKFDQELEARAKQRDIDMGRRWKP